MARRTIGKLAKEAGVGVETVRFYERRGILQQPRKPQQGYRTYSDRDLVTIRYIKEAQGLSFTLSDAQTLIARAENDTTGFCASVRAVARKKLQDTRKQIAELHALESRLEKFLVDCAANKGEKNCPILREIRSCPKQC
jgi:MerR family mercuric resistance operon transcriptional regulator